ncbi:MAG: substrate-binding domain-containing protein [Pseudomonadota bacterium]
MKLKLICAISLAISASAGAEVLHVYGPGGPAPAMMEAAKVYRAQTGTDVRIVAGPTKEWLGKAKADADVVYSGAEHMMTDFVRDMEGRIDERTIDPLYLRVSNILVRPGNPRRIRGLRDLMIPGRKVIVVQGSGQAGLWEDMAGRTGDIRMVRALRRNIVSYAATSADAKAKWSADPSIDAWIIWGVWEKANPTIADTVAVEPQLRIYRDTGTALTMRGKSKPEGARFLAFLRSPAGARIFAKWGWVTSAR